MYWYIQYRYLHKCYIRLFTSKYTLNTALYFLQPNALPKIPFENFWFPAISFISFEKKSVHYLPWQDRQLETIPNICQEKKKKLWLTGFITYPVRLILFIPSLIIQSKPSHTFQYAAFFINGFCCCIIVFKLYWEWQTKISKYAINQIQIHHQTNRGKLMYVWFQ